MNYQETLQQIGRMNLLAISGGRAKAGADGELILPVAHGYSVAIILDASDTYTVQRRWRDKIKGERSGIYFDEVGEQAYQASCYVNVDFN
jgi:hypothetical protein